MRRADLYIIVGLFLFALLIRLPVMGYPVVQDSAIYAGLAEQLHDSGRYWYEGQPHIKYPPGTPLLASFLVDFVKPGTAVRLISVLFSSLTIALAFLFMRHLSVRRDLAAVLSAIILFNPWFLYFTTVLSLSEGAGSFFLLLGLFFLYLYFKEESTGMLSLAALSLGAASMMRSVFLALIMVFSISFLYKIVRDRRFTDGVTFIVLSCAPFLIWTVRNALVKTSGSGYIDYISHSLASFPYGILYFGLIVLPVAFLGALPFLLSAGRKAWKSEYWRLVMLSVAACIVVGVLAWDLVNHAGLIQNPYSASISVNLKGLLLNSLFASRYFVPYIPILTVMIGAMLKRSLGQSKLLWVYAVLLLVFSSFYTFGYIQNSVGGPTTFVKKADAALQVRDFVGQTCVSLDVADETLRASLEELLPCVSSSAGDLVIQGGCRCSCLFESAGTFKASVVRCG